MSRRRWKRQSPASQPTPSVALSAAAAHSTANATAGTALAASTPAVIHLIGYGPHDFREEQHASVESVAAALKQFPVVWVDVEGVNDATLLAEMGRLFHLHPLAVEDTVHTHQRAKVDDFGDVLFVVGRMIQGPPLISEQISFFLGQNFVLTFQEGLAGDCLEPVRERIRQHRGKVREAGTDYLVYELLDAVIDGYFPVLERLGDRLDELDEAILADELESSLAELHQLRGDMLMLRRLIWPHREALQVLMRSGFATISPDAQLYLRDVYDHTAQLMDILEIYREGCSDLREFAYSRLSYRTNEVMRTLTIIATVFMPMSFIAGLYGMNFEHMPELHWPGGYPFALGLMLAIATGFLAYFWRRGWLRPISEDSGRGRSSASGTDVAETPS